MLSSAYAGYWWTIEHLFKCYVNQNIKKRFVFKLITCYDKGCYAETNENKSIMAKTQKYNDVRKEQSLPYLGCTLFDHIHLMKHDV